LLCLRATSCLLQLYVLLGSRQDILQAGDIKFHQVFVERVVGLQSDDKCNRGDIIIAVINQGHLALKITDATFESFSRLHLDHEEVVVISLKLFQ